MVSELPVPQRNKRHAVRGGAASAGVGEEDGTGPTLNRRHGRGHSTRCSLRRFVVEGDATDRAAVSEAMNGGDAVISVLGARGPVMAEATRAIVDAAKQKGPARVVMLSSFAVARDRLTPVTKVVTGIAMGSQIKGQDCR